MGCGYWVSNLCSSFMSWKINLCVLVIKFVVLLVFYIAFNDWSSLLMLLGNWYICKKKCINYVIKLNVVL